MNFSNPANNTSAMFKEDKVYHLMAALTVVIGATTFFANIIVFCVIIKLLTKRDKFGMIIQTFFVCVNDTFCGLLLFLTGLVRVYDSVTAHLCAILVLSTFALQIVSQGNIACVCAQRYIITRYIRKTQATWKSSYTKTLVAVNAAMGTTALVAYITWLQVDNIPPISVTCRLPVVMKSDSIYLIPFNFALGLVFTFVADVFCLLTVRKLKAEISAVVQPSGSTGISSENSASSQDDSARNTMKSRQQTATVTMFLIVVCFNISIVPSIIGYISIYSGYNMPGVMRRPILLAMFVNSLANPFIIATRVQDIRSAIVSIILKVKHTILGNTRN